MSVVNKSRPKIIPNQQGFTLVELLVTILVAVVLIGTLSVVSNNNVYLSQISRDLTIVNSFAENKIEELRSKGYITLANGTTDITSELPSELDTPRSGSVQISDAATGLKLVTLTVSYNAQGRTQTQTYKTFIGELGVGQY